MTDCIDVKARSWANFVLREYYPSQMAAIEERERLAAIDARLRLEGVVINHDPGDEDRS